MPGAGKVKSSRAGSGVILGPGAPTVKVDNKTVSVVGDLVAGHGDSPHNAPLIVTGSSTVFANGKPVVRETVDFATCGHPVVSGSSSVIVG